ncbi:vWA domain-containing protein [Spongorhabdus nitratireducens]
MKTGSISSFRQQQGAAAIMFVIMLPALLAMMTLGVEGARYLRLKGQLDDAIEVASLAVSAREDENIEHNRELARKYIQALVPDAEEISVNIIPRSCKEVSGCGETAPDGKPTNRFIEYQLEVTAKFNSWFPQWDEDGLGFEQKVTDRTRAVARKYYADSIDVVLVLDFSGSMTNWWAGHRKIDQLKTIVRDLADEILTETDDPDLQNTMALVPFNFYTREGNNYGCPVTQMLDTNRPWHSVNHNKTVSKMFTKKKCAKSYYSDSARFHTVLPTSDPAVIKSKIQSMYASHGTAAFEGIIRAAQVAETTHSPHRLIIIVSDGVDSGNWYDTNKNENHKRLLQRNYCDKIRDRLDSQTSASGDSVKSRIAVVGIDYNDKVNDNLTRCAGKENYYTAHNMNELYRLLISLISEEVGRLYDRNYAVPNA